MRFICRHIPLCSVILVFISAVAAYLLFREYELVWPFFLFPYVIFSAFYFFSFFRVDKKDPFNVILYFFVIIPVFAGLTMSIGWMLKIDFIGEMIRRMLS